MNGRIPRIETPNDILPPDAIPNRTSDDRSRGDGTQKHKQQYLGMSHRNSKLTDQIKRVIARQTCKIEVFRENQREQNRNRKPTVRDERCRRVLCAAADFRRAKALRLYHPPIFVSTAIPISAARENHATLACPRGTTTKAASSGPSEDPTFPPT